jgi:hypothetical protein
LKPRFTVIILLFGVAAVALMGIVHGFLNKHEAPATPPTEVPAENASSQGASNTVVDPQAGGNIAMTAEEQAALKRQKDLDAVNDALGNGQGDLQAMLEIANRLENPDAEVRTVAREAAVHLGDTNIIPFLNTALNNLQDAREKVAIMDAIEYLSIPVAPEGYPDPAVEAILTNPMTIGKFGPQMKRRAQPKAGRAAAPEAPAQAPPAVTPGTP